MIELRLYIWSMIVKKRVKACLKVKTTVWWVDVFTQTLLKDINQRI